MGGGSHPGRPVGKLSTVAAILFSKGEGVHGGEGRDGNVGGGSGADS